MKGVIIGFGRAGQLHRMLYPVKVKVIGVVEPVCKEPAAASRRSKKASVNMEAAINQGLNVYTSIKDAANAAKPDFWDICTQKESHLRILEELIKLDSKANIIVERPVCGFSDIASVEQLVQSFRGKVAVNESYKSSAVTRRIASFTEKYGLAPSLIRVEFSENRVTKALKKGSVDKELLAFGYEGENMLAAVAGLGSSYLPKQLRSSSATDMALPDGRRLSKQGTALATYIAANGVRVDLASSMTGRIRFPLGVFNPSGQLSPESTEKYRVLAAYDLSKRMLVAGQYPPVPGFNDIEGRVYALSDETVIGAREHVYDHSVHVHLGLILSYFEGMCENPSPVSEAAAFLRFLHLMKDNAK